MTGDGCLFFRGGVLMLDEIRIGYEKMNFEYLVLNEEDVKA